MILLFPFYLDHKFHQFPFSDIYWDSLSFNFFSEAPHTVSKPSEDQLEDKLNLFLWFPLPDSVGIDSIT